MPDSKTPRLYTIPLQDAWKVPYKRRAKKAVALIQKFVERHMKADGKSVRVGTALNEAVWSRGIKFPPRKVKVQVVPHERDIKGKKITDVWVELEGVKLELEKKKEEKKAGKKPEAKAEKKGAEPQKPEGESSEKKDLKETKGLKEEKKIPEAAPEKK